MRLSTFSPRPIASAEFSLRPFVQAHGPLLRALGLTGHSKGKVEAFYWTQRLLAKRIKLMRPRATKHQVLCMLTEALRDSNTEAGRQDWQQRLFSLLLSDSDLLTGAFNDAKLDRARHAPLNRA